MNHELLAPGAPVAQVAAAPSQPAEYPIRFTASGGEYFGIWIVNLLLIVLTLGIYLPWAKVRRLKYFYNNTEVAGHALDFHGQGSRMLRGTLIVGAFFILYSIASNFSPWAALVAALAFLALWPMLFRAGMRFRLSQTSWRGLRFRFTGNTADAYLAVLPPLALILVPVVLGGLFAGTPDSTAKIAEPPGAVLAAIGLSFLLFFLGLPYFLWRVKRYQHNHYAYGPLTSELRAGAGVFYGIFLKIIGAALVMALGLVLVGFLLPQKGLAGLGLIVVFLAPLIFFGFLLMNLVAKSYVVVRLQNLVWTRTGNAHFRFKSNLRLAPYIGLQFKNYLLIALSVGFYWPFAVVATRRAQLEAVSLFTRIDLDTLVDRATRAEADATGDAAAEVFDLDVGI